MGRLHPIVQVLSLQEQRVLFYLSQELSSKQIADVLHISPETVDTHRRNIRRKLKIEGPQGLLLYAVRHRDFLKGWSDGTSETENG